jgi:hypothetical protein
MDAIPLLADDAGAVFGGFLSLIAVFWIIAIAGTIFWLWALVDCLTHEPTADDKILWFLVIFFLHFVGAILYVVIRRSKHAAVTGT